MSKTYRVNLTAHRYQAVEAARAAAGDLVDKIGPDMTKWTKEQFTLFVLTCLEVGAKTAEVEFAERLRREIAELDQIPY
jgi:hypothetical protein